jgi:hypothetical protein
VDDGGARRTPPRCGGADLTVEGRDDGTNRRARLGVTYAAGSGPATVFVKAVDPDHEAMIELTATRPLTPEQAADGVRGLARMHGTFWNHRVRRPELDWLEPFVPWDGMQYAPQRYSSAFEDLQTAEAIAGIV